MRRQSAELAGLGFAAAAAALAVLTLACEQAAPPAPPPDVVVEEVIQKDTPIYAEWVGTTDGNINAQIRARVSGYLESRSYREGSLVRAGDALFQIDPRPYRAALDQAKGELGRVTASQTKTQQDVTRYTPLASDGAISQQELDNAVQANRAANAAVDAARANVRKAQLDLDWTKVQSPIDGIAGIAVAQVGDLINANTVLTTVSELNPIKVSFAISEQEYMSIADRISLNQPGTAQLQLVLADGNVYPEPGTASIANREVDSNTGTLTIVGLFPNPRNVVRPGQFAKVRATTRVVHGALLVPQRSVQELQGLHQLAVVGADNKVEIRNVKAGARVGNWWIIDEGVSRGDRVIVEGIQKVRNGLTVNPVPAAPAAST